MDYCIIVCKVHLLKPHTQSTQYLPTSSPPLEAPLMAMRLGVVYFSWIRYSAAHWKSSKQRCLFPNVPAANAQQRNRELRSEQTVGCCFPASSVDVCTFVPGEAVLPAPSDVGHRQDPSEVSHIQQVRDAGHRQDRQSNESPLGASAFIAA